MEKIIAVSYKSYQKFGCPHCGYQHCASSMSGGGASDCICPECSKTSVVLAEGLTTSSIGFGDPPVFPVLEKHPREGIPSHGTPDMRPTSGDFFNSRGIGLDWIPGCFVCGGKKDLHPNIAAFVKTKEAGERVVKLFTTGVFLDYRSQEPTWIQVKIGACEKHKPNLEALHALTKDGIITQEKVDEAKK